MPDSPIPIPASNNVNEQLRFHSSANFLCNFMGRREYLVDAIKLTALRPRYVEERIDYLRIEGHRTLTFPMTCFCDIPLSKVDEHMVLYGSYGIALNKSRCLYRDVQPVMYLNTCSRLADDFSSVFRRVLESDEHIDRKWQFLPDMVLSLLLYTKPVSGPMRRGHEELENQLFIDECEWRYVPEMPDDMPLFMDPRDSTPEGITAYSAALAKHRETWFTFSVDDLEYIIVPDESEAVEVMRAIDGMADKDDVSRHRLMTKIETADKFTLNFV